MERFAKIITACYERGFSDLHIVGDHPLVCRRDGELVFQKQHVLSVQYIDQLVDMLLNDRQKRRLRQCWSADVAVTVAGKRLRINVFSSHRGVSMAIRFLPEVIPTLESLNLHPSLKDFCGMRSGLLVICGSTGSGKSTTIAAIINEINATRACHVVTLEDPIEFLFPSKRAFIEQRELGKHFHSFQRGLLDVLRQAPDIIVLGEMRSAETIQLALDAAESGHLVIATMHAGSHEEAVHRMCGVSGLSLEYTRIQISQSLVGIINQQLAYLPAQRFSVPVLSVLRNTRAISNIIRENKLSQLDSFLSTCKDQGMFTFEAYRDDYLSGKKDFRRPMEKQAKAPGGAPQEHLSQVFDYDAATDGDRRERRDQPAAPRAEGPAAQGRFYDLSNDDVDGYIDELEQRVD